MHQFIVILTGILSTVYSLFVLMGGIVNGGLSKKDAVLLIFCSAAGACIICLGVAWPTDSILHWLLNS